MISYGFEEDHSDGSTQNCPFPPALIFVCGKGWKSIKHGSCLQEIYDLVGKTSSFIHPAAYSFKIASIL